MVNKERVWLWIEALRSGKFEQARDTLREGNKYCCLGVACEVAIRNGLELRQDGLHSYSYDGKFSNLGTLPQSVVDWYGLPAASPQLGQFSATDRNDERKESFNEIAAHIEKEYFNEDS